MAPSREAEPRGVTDHDPPTDVADVIPPAGPIDGTDPPADGAPEVALLRWPAEDERRVALAAAGRPRLLVLDADAPPPLVWDDQEDWVRSPADPLEVQARLRTLARRPGPAAAVPSTVDPTLDADGIVRWGGSWVAVPPIEARLLAVLLTPRGAVARRDDMVAAAWPAGVGSDRVLDGRIRHLRRRLRPLGLAIRTVRGVGFLLEAVDEADPPS